MKKSLALILVLLFCLLAACGNDGGTTPSSPAAGAPESSAPPSSSGSGEEPREDASSASGEDEDTSASGTGAPASTEGGANDAAVWETMKLIAVDDNLQGGRSLTAVGENGSLLSFAAPEAVAYSAELEPVLLPGTTVQVGYDGYVMETYPGQITAEYLTAEAYDGGLISLYLDALEDLYGQDTGMNDSCTYFGFDLSGAPGLTPAEQQAVGWVFATSQGCEPLFGTIEELGREGYINMEGRYWEDGLHFTLRADSPAEDYFTLDCTKWKSGTGAIGYQQAAEKKDGSWVQGEAGEFWIS